MDQTPFFILIKTFVGTTASEMLMNEFLSSILKKRLVICVKKSSLTKNHKKENTCTT